MSLRNNLIVCFIAAVVLNLIIETLARLQPHPGYGGLWFLFNNPLPFIDNVMIIFATLTVSIIFKKRTFFFVLISCIWLGIGVANGIILTQRMTPFTVKDFKSIKDGITIINNYMSPVQICMLIGGIFLIVVAFVFLFRKTSNNTKRYRLRKSLLTVFVSLVCTVALTFGLIRVGTMETFFGNLAYAYRDYGMPYCFVNTWLNTGIHRPYNYSKKNVMSIFTKDEYMSPDGTMKLQKGNLGKEPDAPNIIFLQLESFVDPRLFKNIKVSKDPVPNFRRLMDEYSSGSLKVPACGAGTANTEFETMTGLSVKFFGPGEYPFNSILKKRPAESIARDLKSQGYGTHAIHNHRAMFYNRNLVFSNLGFDTFTSVEYMSDVKRTPKNWAKDDVLTKQIMDAIESTKSRDYIYTISTQGHGKYPEEKLLADPEITVTADNEATKNKYEYFSNQVYDMDKFIGDLTRTLDKLDEPTVLVMYGDHIPALDVLEENYANDDLYSTQYVMWHNKAMDKQGKLKRIYKNLHSYNISAQLLDRLGIHVGTTTIYHQRHSHRSPDYLKKLKMLGYDMLYGKCYIYGGCNPFHKTDMKMGVLDIKINKIVMIGDKYYIKGKNFTENSKIALDGKTLKTVYINPELLGLLEDVDPEDVKRMKVSQIDNNSKSILSTAE